MNPRLKKILNFVFIFGTLGVVLLIGVNGEEMSGAVDALKSVAPLWIALCAVAYGGYVLMDALSVHYYLRKQGYPITVGYALYVAICGLYYSNITPGATGGQPMQVYYLTKRNVPIGIGTSALTVKFFSFQFMLAVYSTVLWIAYGSYVASCVGSNMWILIVGYVYNMFSVSLVVLMAINKRLVWAIIKLLVRIGAKFRLCKHPEATLTKWEDVLDTFHSSVMSLREHPGQLVVQLLIGGAQLIALMTVTFFIYKGFELAGASYGQIITMAMLLYVSAAYTPLPGASGAQEGVFALYFANIFPSGIRLMALLLWRFFTYYISLIIGAIVTIVKGFHPDKQKAAQDVAK